MDIDVIKEAQKVFDIEIESLVKIRNELDGNFTKLIEMILPCEGKVILTGMGKSGHIARKISSTMASLGISSFFVHPGEGVHGDLGMITNKDLVIAISYSGETDEVIQLIPSIKRIGAKLVSITGKEESSLDKYSDLSINLNIIREACQHNLAPTTSTTATLVFGDALAVVLSQIIGFKPDDFTIFHPKGSLGKRLLTTVGDLMHTGEENPIVRYDETVKRAIIEISSKGLGAVSVINENKKLVGIITDGDIRRSIERYDNVLSLSVNTIMTNQPIKTKPDALAVDALKIMQKGPRHIMVLPVIDDNNEVIGMIRLHDIVKAGIK